MRKIFIADIFGRTPELEELTCSVGGQSEIIDPYSGRFIDFADESEAYTHFMDTVSIEEYCKVLKTKLKLNSTPTELIGFSVGASVLWRISDSLNPEFITSVVCFYGSQIRHHQKICPSLRIELILPNFESNFDVNEFAQNMSEKTNVFIHKTNFLHGFMNSRSKNFNHIGYKYYVEWLYKGDSQGLRRFDRLL